MVATSLVGIGLHMLPGSVTIHTLAAGLLVCFELTSCSKALQQLWTPTQASKAGLAKHMVILICPKHIMHLITLLCHKPATHLVSGELLYPVRMGCRPGVHRLRVSSLLKTCPLKKEATART